MKKQKNSIKAKTIKALENELAAMRSTYETQLGNQASTFYRQRLQLEEAYRKQHNVALEVARTADALSTQLALAKETIAVTAQSMDIERLDLMARAERLGMRISGLGFAPVLK
jgi:hypothetical protein